MKKQNIDDFKMYCSDLYLLFTRPREAKRPVKNDRKQYDRLIIKADKSEEELAFIQEFDKKMALFNDPPLSKSIISGLISRYGAMKYQKRTAVVGSAMSFLKKGTDMELEAVDLLSRIDKIKYSRNESIVSNDFITGKCDISCESKSKVIDTKISWNVNAFLKARTTPLSKKYWFQAQGYMELYNKDSAEIAFLLLNTPLELVEREKIRILNRFMTGEIDRDKYDLAIENLDGAFTYGNIPIKRRVFRYVVKRNPEIFETVYNKVKKARIWMNEFDKELGSNIFLLSSDNYLKAEENNIESDSADACESDAG